ncbi:hypothetical protein CLOBL_49140 [Clostridium sp. BL-8]|nr:hypothetical protein CLOBL_49140 [Clostridium sp. BL-8]
MSTKTSASSIFSSDKENGTVLIAYFIFISFDDFAGFGVTDSNDACILGSDVSFVPVVTILFIFILCVVIFPAVSVAVNE